MTEDSLITATRYALAELDRIREELAVMKDRERLCEREARNLMQAARIRELAIAADRVAKLETPVTKSVDYDTFDAWAKESGYWRSCGRGCVETKIAIGKIEHDFDAEAIDALIAKRAGDARIRIVTKKTAAPRRKATAGKK